jgi:iron complex outermembrane receptor protein
MSLSSLQPLRLLLCISLGCAPFAGARAQPDDADDPAPPPDGTLPTVQVQGQAAGDYVAKRTRVLRTDTPLGEIAQSISIVTDAQLRDQDAKNMQEALRYTVGVRADQYGLDNRGDWYSLRAGSTGTQLLNGLRLPLSGYYGLVREEPFAFERIEVLHGPSSVLAGQNAPGGVVNLVSKRPRADASSEVALEVGNRDLRQVAVDVGGALDASGTWLYRLLAVRRDNDTQVDFADDHRRFVAPSLTWKPNEATTVTAYAEYQQDHNRNTNGFFPWAGTLLPAPNGRIPWSRFVGEPDWDRNAGQRLRLGYEFEYRLGDDWSLRHDLRQDRLSGVMRTIYADFTQVDRDGNGYGDDALGPSRTIKRIAYGTDDHSLIRNADLLLEGHVDSGRIRQTLLFGLDAMSWKASQAVSGDVACPLPFDIYAPVYGTCAEPSADPALFTRSRTVQSGFVVQDQIKFDERWVVTASARRDHVETSVANIDRVRTGRNDDWATTRNLGLVYLAGGGWSPYLGYSESFQPVQGTDHAGAPFRPSRGRQKEIGLKWIPDDGRISATASVYKLDETGRLSPDPDNVGYSVQRGRIEAKGIELEAHANLGRWELIANYSHAEAEDASTGFRPESLPENSGAFWAMRAVDALPGLRLGAGVRYVGRTWDGADDLVTPSNTLFDAVATWENERWQLALNAVNLTDKRYVVTCLARGDCWLGTRRRVTATLSYRW